MTRKLKDFENIHQFRKRKAKEAEEYLENEGIAIKEIYYSLLFSLVNELKNASPSQTEGSR